MNHLRNIPFILIILLSLILIPAVSPSCPSALLKCDGTTIANDSISFTYVQTAKEGSFLFGLNGTYILSLKQVVPYTFYYSDRPFRVAGSESVTDFINSFSWNPEPVAVLTLPDAKSDMDTLFVQLSKPKYNAYSESLEYNARILKDYNGTAFPEIRPDVDAHIPESFNDATIYLSSEGQGSGCPPDHPYRCSNGRCAVNRVPCPPSG